MSSNKIGLGILLALLGSLQSGCADPVRPNTPHEAAAVAFGEKFIRLLHNKKWKEAYELTSDDYQRSTTMARLRDDFESIGHSGSFFQCLNAATGSPLTESSVAELYKTHDLPPQSSWIAHVITRVGQPDGSRSFVEVGAEADLLVVRTPKGLRAGCVRVCFSD